MAARTPLFLAIAGDTAVTIRAGVQTVYAGADGFHELAAALAQSHGGAGPGGLHTIVTAGGLGFEWQKLVASTPDTADDVKALATGSRHYDMLFDMACTEGYPVPLQSVVPDDVDVGSTAESKCAAVKAVWSYGERHGMLVRRTIKGKKQPWPLQDAVHAHCSKGQPTLKRLFRSVKDCVELVRLHPPDQSWQTDPTPTLGVLEGLE